MGVGGFRSSSVRCFSSLASSRAAIPAPGYIREYSRHAGHTSRRWWGRGIVNRREDRRYA
jgi:hypothetical protein